MSFVVKLLLIVTIFNPMLSHAGQQCRAFFSNVENNAAVESPDEFIKAFRVEYKKMIGDPSEFKRKIIERRKQWSLQHPDKKGDFPIAEYQPLIKLMRFELSSKVDAFNTHEYNDIHQAYQQLIARCDKAIELGTPYSEAIGITLDFGPALDLYFKHIKGPNPAAYLLNYADRKEVTSPLKEKKESLMRQLLGLEPEDSPGITGALENPDELLLPVPFGLGFRSISRFFIRNISPIGIKFDDATSPDGHDTPSAFEVHDMIHWAGRLEDSFGMSHLSDHEVDELEKKLLEKVDGLTAKDMDRFGLSANDLPYFIKALDVAFFVTVHESPSLPFGHWKQISVDRIRMPIVGDYREDPKRLTDYLGVNATTVAEKAVQYWNDMIAQIFVLK